MGRFLTMSMCVAYNGSKMKNKNTSNSIRKNYLAYRIGFMTAAYENNLF